jgi:hypothetical protein
MMSHRGTCAGEEVAILVEGHRHDAVCGVESLLHPVAVVDVDVHIQHTAIYVTSISVLRYRRVTWLLEHAEPS